jgi:3-hydroxybutyryl-CoA dehydratase
MNIQVGQEVPGLVKKMTQEVINQWARLSKDYNPIHIDPDFARQTRFGGTIAHGHLALSYLGEMMLAWAEKAWVYSGKLEEIKFVAPVYPGKTYRLGGAVTGIAELAENKQQINCEVYVKDTAEEHDCVTGKASFITGED